MNDDMIDQGPKTAPTWRCYYCGGLTITPRTIKGHTACLCCQLTVGRPLISIGQGSTRVDHACTAAAEPEKHPDVYEAIAGDVEDDLKRYAEDRAADERFTREREDQAWGPLDGS